MGIVHLWHCEKRRDSPRREGGTKLEEALVGCAGRQATSHTHGLASHAQAGVIFMHWHAGRGGRAGPQSARGRGREAAQGGGDGGGHCGDHLQVDRWVGGKAGLLFVFVFAGTI